MDREVHVEHQFDGSATLLQSEVSQDGKTSKALLFCKNRQVCRYGNEFMQEMEKQRVPQNWSQRLGQGTALFGKDGQDIPQNQSICKSVSASFQAPRVLVFM